MAIKKYRWLAQELCLYLSVSKEEGVCGLPRSASSHSLNRPILKMEKQRGAVNISIREDEAILCRKVMVMQLCCG
jgi:hypothetical protein